MDTILITEDNLVDFEDILPADVAENIGRDIYGGMVLCEDDERAAAVWEINHLEDATKPVTSRLFWLFSKKRQDLESLFSMYGLFVNSMMIRKSTVDLPKAEAEGVEKALLDAEFEVTEREGSDLVVTVGDLAKLDVVKKTKLPPNLYPFDKLMSRPYRSGIMNCIFRTKREILEDLSNLPMEWFDPELSCYVQTDDRVTGFLLVHKLPSGRLRVEFMSAIGPDARIDLVYMVRYSIMNAVKSYPKDTQVILPRRDLAAQKLVEYFFPGMRGEAHIFGEREEKL